MGSMKLSVDHNGTTFKSLVEMCTYYNISVPAYLLRLRLGWNKQDALEKPTQKKKVKDHKGIKYNSMQDMCTAYNKSIDQVRYRLKHNWSLEAALESPVDKTRITKKTSCEDHLGIKYTSKSEMCASYGISKALFEYRLSKNWTLEDALTKSPKANKKESA